MTNQTATTGDFSLAARDEIARLFERHAQKIEKIVRETPPEWLWEKPFPFGNSIGHLVLHLTGNLSHYIGANLAGTGYVRDREREFVDPVHPATDDLLARYHDAVATVVKTIRSLDNATLAAKYESPQPVQSRLGVFLVCASHMENHVGQMAYLAQAIRLKGEPSPDIGL